MKISFMPKTNLGKWSVWLVVGFFVFLGVFAFLVASGERGGETFFSNLKLTIPMIIAVACAIGSFFTGAIGIIRKKDYSVLVFISTLVGFFVLWFSVAEIVFPH